MPSPVNSGPSPTPQDQDEPSQEIGRHWSGDVDHPLSIGSAALEERPPMHLPGVTSGDGITSPSGFSSHILASLPAYSIRTCVTLLPVSRLSHRTRSHYQRVLRTSVVPTAAPRHDPRLLLALSTGLRGICSQPPSSLASCHTRSRSRFSMDVSAASTIDEVPASCPQAVSETGALVPQSR